MGGADESFPEIVIDVFAEDLEFIGGQGVDSRVPWGLSSRL